MRALLPQGSVVQNFIRGPQLSHVCCRKSPCFHPELILAMAPPTPSVHFKSLDALYSPYTSLDMLHAFHPEEMLFYLNNSLVDAS